jgi:DNA-binding Lrp family transcriptional regulator
LSTSMNHKIGINSIYFCGIMSTLKDVDLKILSELMKNSKASDRQLAKKIGVSQPTVTRRRARLERELIDGSGFCQVL